MVRPSVDLTIPHATKPSVARTFCRLIVATSTIASPLGFRETKARWPSLLKIVQIGAFPVAAKESCAPGYHVCAASSTLTLIRLLRATCATRSVDPLGEGLAWWVAAGAKFRVFTTRRVAVWITSRSPFPMPETYAYFPSGENVVM